MLPDYVEIAHQIAISAHAGQVDKAGKDYIRHPETVASFVKTDEEKAAAYLHDTLEDSSVTADDLRKAGIPESVIRAVKLLTHDKSEDYLEYLDRVKVNPIARVVKLADLKHNSDLSRIKNVTEEDKQRLAKYQKAVEYLKS
jgi:(p)ppGpp synthase/HD superfamily hydrolase